MINVISKEEHNINNYILFNNCGNNCMTKSDLVDRTYYSIGNENKTIFRGGILVGQSTT